MKIIVAPNSFRGSLNAFQVADAITAGFRRAIPDVEIVRIPIADGGELTIDVLVNALGGKILQETVLDPLCNPVAASYGILGDGTTAVIEMSRASGVSLIAPELLNPMRATSYGTGQLIKAALDLGCRKIIVGLGGSATVDGGAGMLQALGVKLLDNQGRQIGYGGDALAELHHVDTNEIDRRLSKVELVIACDIDTKLLGPNGAALMFGPQKGATPQMAQELDSNLSHFAQIILRDLHCDVTGIPYGGASGGIAAAMYAFMGARLERGIDLVLEHINFKKHLIASDLVITAEGKLDLQTLRWKGPYGVAQAARSSATPVLIIVGAIDKETEQADFSVFDAIVPICNRPMSLDSSMRNAASLILEAAERAARLLTVGMKLSNHL
jgi:glycerate kinase